MPALKRSNFFAACLIAVLSLSVCSSADAGFFKKKKYKKEKVLQLETSRYRVYYIAGAPEKKPELGTDDYSELQYKAVFQDDWVSDTDRLIQIDFLDKQGFIVARDVVADKDFNAQGEHYGYLWVAASQVKNIKKAEVKEVFQKNKVEATGVVVEPVQPAAPAEAARFDRRGFYEEKHPELKEIMDKKVLTEEDIEKALAMTRHAGSAKADGSEEEKEKKEEGDDEDAVSMEKTME